MIWARPFFFSSMVARPHTTASASPVFVRAVWSLPAYPGKPKKSVAVRSANHSWKLSLSQVISSLRRAPRRMWWPQCGHTSRSRAASSMSTMRLHELHLA